MENGTKNWIAEKGKSISSHKWGNEISATLLSWRVNSPYLVFMAKNTFLILNKLLLSCTTLSTYNNLIFFCHAIHAARIKCTLFFPRLNLMSVVPEAVNEIFPTFRHTSYLRLLL